MHTLPYGFGLSSNIGSNIVISVSWTNVVWTQFILLFLELVEERLRTFFPRLRLE